jgi:hypothetical protein
MTDGRPAADAGTPRAVVRPARGISWAWAVPVLALVLAGWLGYRAWELRGLIITVQLDQGHGLKSGDPVRYLGLTIGEVRHVEIDEDLGGGRVTASLWSQPRRFARAGSRYWVVRPQLGVTGVGGLETLFGPRYLAVLPGEGAPQRRFVALAEPPLVASIEPGDLEILLQASSRRGLRRGAPVLYRQVRVGTVLSVGLTSDGGAVEARVHIQKPYAKLVRPESRFWSVSGVQAGLGLGGLSFEMEDLQTLLTGGVALATPAEHGPPVSTGYRFELGPEPEGWLSWQPLVAIGSTMLPPGAVVPTPLRATIGWRQGWLFRGQQSMQGWVLPTDRGLLGPADLLVPDPDARAGSVVLELAGKQVPLDAAPTWTDGRLALIDLSVEAEPWVLGPPAAASSESTAEPPAPEDCLVVGDHRATPVPLAASRLTEEQGNWLVDPAVALDATSHGACVVARSDGRLVGLLLVGEEDAVPVVALLAR